MDTREPAHRSDQEYVRECLNGHPEQFRYLAERYQRVLLSQLLAELRDRSDAEDAAQEALVRAYFWLPSLKNRPSFFSWLMGIAHRVASEHRRSEARERKAVVGAGELLKQRQVENENDYPLEEAIALLPETQRQVVLLRYYTGMSCSEVAHELGVPLGSVTKTLSRAYAALRDRLRDEASEVQR